MTASHFDPGYLLVKNDLAGGIVENMKGEKWAKCQCA